ncbi:MAG: hypothetical protein ACOCZK_00935 [Planctomycetota bacterium]
MAISPHRLLFLLLALLMLGAVGCAPTRAPAPSGPVTIEVFRTKKTVIDLGDATHTVHTLTALQERLSAIETARPAVVRLSRLLPHAYARAVLGVVGDAGFTRVRLDPID